jgi:YHS domain-containing protein
MPFWTKQKAKDPVCGMEIEPKKTKATHDYQGKTYYFCSPACQANFKKEPDKYVKAGA